MDAQKQTRVCQNCGLLKSLVTFIVGKDKVTGKNVYSVICSECRSQYLQDEEDESGGKKRGLAVNHEDKDFQVIKQQEQNEKTVEEKLAYFEEQELIKEKSTEKEMLDSRNQRTATDKKQQKPMGLFSSQEIKKPLKSSEFSTAYSYDQNIHDPHRQKQITNLSETTYNVNADRMDVKLARQNINRADAFRHGRFLGTAKPATKTAAALAKTATKASSSMFSQKTAQDKSTAKKAAESKAEQVVEFIKNTWGKRR